MRKECKVGNVKLGTRLKLSGGFPGLEKEGLLANPLFTHINERK